MNTPTLPGPARLFARVLQHALPTAQRLAIGLTGTAAALTLGVAQGASMTVTSLADSGAGSLRDAITAANSSVSIADTINFSVSGTITLASRLPEIGDDVTIDGSGKSITISGNHAVQVMFVRAGTTLNLAALTIANGKCASPCSGGAILNVGTLKVTSSTFSGNSALLGGAIHNFGSLEVAGSTFSGNSARFGGAIHNFDTLTVNSSRFLGNSAAHSGGAIHNFDTLDVAGSMFSGNSAAVAGPDVSNGAHAESVTATKGSIVCSRLTCIGSGAFAHPAE